MRKFALGVMTAAVALVAAASPSRAQSPNSYPWCLVISDKLGSWTCYFKSREQCMASAGGNVGFCTQNPAYQGPQPGLSTKRRGGRID